jgi:hypothetical protein
MLRKESVWNELVVHEGPIGGALINAVDAFLEAQLFSFANDLSLYFKIVSIYEGRLCQWF